MVAERSEFSQESILTRLTRAGSKAIEEAQYILRESEKRVAMETHITKTGHDGNLNKSLLAFNRKNTEQEAFNQVLLGEKQTKFAMAMSTASSFVNAKEKKDVIPKFKQDLSLLAQEIAETHQKSLDKNSAARRKMSDAINSVCEAKGLDFPGTNFKDNWIDEALAFGIGAVAAVAIAPVLLGTTAAVATAAAIGIAAGGGTVASLAWSKTMGNVDFNARGRMKTIEMVNDIAAEQKIYIPANLSESFVSNFLQADRDIFSNNFNKARKYEAIRQALIDFAGVYPESARGADAQLDENNSDRKIDANETKNQITQENSVLQAEIAQATSELESLQSQLNDQLASNTNDAGKIAGIKQAMANTKANLQGKNSQLFTNEERIISLDDNIIAGLNFTGFDVRQKAFDAMKHSQARTQLEQMGIPIALQKIIPGVGAAKLFNLRNMMDQVPYKNRQKVFKNWDKYLNFDNKKRGVDFKIGYMRKERIAAIKNLRGMEAKFGETQHEVSHIQNELAAEYQKVDPILKAAEQKWVHIKIAEADLIAENNNLALASEDLSEIDDEKKALEAKKAAIKADPNKAKSVKTEEMAIIENKLTKVAEKVKAIQAKITQIQKDITVKKTAHTNAKNEYETAQVHAATIGLRIHEPFESEFFKHPNHPDIYYRNMRQTSKIFKLRKKLETAVGTYNDFAIKMAESEDKVTKTEKLIQRYQELYSTIQSNELTGLEFCPGFQALCAPRMMRYWKNHTLTAQNISDFGKYLDETGLIEGLSTNKVKNKTNNFAPDRTFPWEDQFEVNRSGLVGLNDKDFDNVSDFFDWLRQNQKANTDQESKLLIDPKNPDIKPLDEDTLKQDAQIELKTGIMLTGVSASTENIKQTLSEKIIPKIDKDRFWTGNLVHAQWDTQLSETEKNSINNHLAHAISGTYASFAAEFDLPPTASLEKNLKPEIIKVFNANFDIDTGLNKNPRYKDRFETVINEIDDKKILELFQQYHQGFKYEQQIKAQKNALPSIIRPNRVIHDSVSIAFEQIWDDVNTKNTIEDIRTLQKEIKILKKEIENLNKVKKPTKVQQKEIKNKTADIKKKTTGLTNKFDELEGSLHTSFETEYKAKCIKKSIAPSQSQIDAVRAKIKDIDLIALLNQPNETLAASSIAQMISPISAASNLTKQFDWNVLANQISEGATLVLAPNSVRLQDTFLKQKTFAAPYQLQRVTNEFFVDKNPNENFSTFWPYFVSSYNDVDIPWIAEDLSARDLSYKNFQRFTKWKFKTKLKPWSELSIDDKKLVDAIFREMRQLNAHTEAEEIISPPEKRSFSIPIPSVIWDFDLDASLEGIKSRIKLVWDGMKDFLKDLSIDFSGLGDTFKKFWGNLKDFMQDLGEGAVFNWEKFVDFLKTVGIPLEKTWENIKDSAKAIWEWIIRRLDSLFGWTEEDANEDEGGNNEEETPDGEETNDDLNDELDSITDETEVLNQKYQAFYYGTENQDWLSSAAQSRLDILGKSIEYTMKTEGGTKDDYKVVIESFCTTSASDAYNDDLAKARSVNTQKYLRSKKLGIDTKSIETDPTKVGLKDHTGEKWKEDETSRKYNHDTGGEDIKTYTNFAPNQKEESVALAATRYKNRRTLVRLFKKDGNNYKEVKLKKGTETTQKQPYTAPYTYGVTAKFKDPSGNTKRNFYRIRNGDPNKKQENLSESAWRKLKESQEEKYPKK
jgi:hypothetical protein